MATSCDECPLATTLADPNGKANQRSDPMNTTMGSRQLQCLLDLAEQKGLTPHRMTAILSSGVLADVMDAGADLSDRRAVRMALKLLGVPLSEPIVLAVDYSMSLNAMIAAGNYDYRNGDISGEWFAIYGAGIVNFEAKLVFPNRNISSADVEAQIRALDGTNLWRPGKIQHLLSFGAKFPEEQRRYPIVGLGSVVRIGGVSHAPYLDGDGLVRSLRLDFLRDAGWNANCRFLAVRKISDS